MLRRGINTPPTRALEPNTPMHLHRDARALLALLVTVSACDAGPFVRDCAPGAACDPDASTPADGASRDVTARDVTDLFTDLIELNITPADATLTARGGPATQEFTVVGRYRDGTARPLALGTWRATDSTLGAIDAATGRYTATGLVGGTTRIEVEIAREGAAPLRVQTDLRVRVEREVFAGDTPMSARASFAGALAVDPERAATLRYPLAGTVMPQNVAPPDVQWEGGAQGDVYRVQVSKPSVLVTGYVLHTGEGFRFHWPVDAAGWRAIVESEPDAAARVQVDRSDARGAVAGASAELRIARGSLLGVVYYWDLRAGKILRILDESATREDFMPSPPRRASDGSRCVACHAISRDGRYMAAEMFEGQGPGAVFDLTRDLRVDPAPTRFPLREAASWVYATWNPDSTRLLANRLGGLFLVDPATGDRVPSGGSALPANDAVQPAWSPDGRTVAFVDNFVGPGPSAFEESELATLPVTDVDTFGPSRTLLRGAQLALEPQRGRAVAYPTWTPDSRWIAFQHGPYSESDIEVAAGVARRRFPAAVYLVAPGGGSPLRMTNASGLDGDSDAYFPNFSPFNQGGYYWVLFFSRRDYGNASAGTRGTGRRQLWVSAVTNNPIPGRDPSSVPYWLPGQDVASDNVSGYWAPQACAPRGAHCTVSSECCAGSCGPDARGALVCNPPPAGAACRRSAERCGATSDCCAGLECAGNVCLAPPV